jgi:hypothetical protein
MSQSSQESINLLSPPPEPVSIARGPHGLLAIDNVDGVRNDDDDKRISTEARFTSANRRRDNEENKHSWRAYTKTYKKDSPSNKKPESKRPSDEFLETYLPHAISSRMESNIGRITKNMEQAELLMSTIEVPEEERGGFYGAMSQMTMTQAIAGAFDDEDEENDENDVFEFRSVGEKGANNKTGGESSNQKEYVPDINERQSVEASETNNAKLSLDKSKPYPSKEVANDKQKAEINEVQAAQEMQPTSLEFKPLPPEVAAAAKKKKKGPTDKALLEENYESQKSDKSNIAECPENFIDECQFEEAASPLDEQSSSAKSYKLEQSSSQEAIEELPQNEPKQTREQTILANYNAIENIGKSLSCPICCHSLQSSTFLPCGHAFCQSCLDDSLKSNPTCPVCRLKCSRRSGSRIGQLDDIVKGYKGVMRAFGFAPVVYSKRVGMTQLSPGKEEGKKRKLNADEAWEHHQGWYMFAWMNDNAKIIEISCNHYFTALCSVAQSNHQAFASLQKLQAPPPATLKSSGNRITKEELERLNMTRRYQLLAADQVAVMQADKEALEKVTRKKQMVVEATLEFAGKNTGETAACLQSKVDNKNADTSGAADVQIFDDGKKLAALEEEDRKIPAIMAPKESQDTFYTALKSNNDEVGKKDLVSASIPPSLPPIESQETFHTAKSEYSKATNQPVRYSVATAPSPIILHDGNTAKKEKQGDLETERVDNRHSLATAASTIVLHDGNTVEKKKADNADHTPRRSGRYLPLTGEADVPKATELGAGIGDSNEETDFGQGFVASQQSFAANEDLSPKLLDDKNESSLSIVNREVIVGSVVMVQSRTWPGINKHGGEFNAVLVFILFHSHLLANLFLYKSM